VQAVAGQFLRGFLGQAVHLPEQLLAQFQQPLAYFCHSALTFFGSALV